MAEYCDTGRPPLRGKADIEPDELQVGLQPEQYARGQLIMKTSVLERDASRIVECLEPIATTGDALGLVSSCIENDATRLLLEDRHLPPAFFDLRTGFAGEFVQKLVNYRMQLAVVFSDVSRHGQRFEQFVLEARRGRGFRAFDDRESALAWLAAG